MIRTLVATALAVGACAPAARQSEPPPVQDAPPSAVHDHEHAGVSGEQLGSVDFPVSCSPEAQLRFNRAMALLHSFWWSEAHRAFDHVLEADPSCAMAHWGHAMAWRGNPFGPPPAAALEAGLAAAEKALALGPPSPRERGYVDAVLALYRDFPTVDQRTRSLAYEAALERLHREHPDDPEAAMYYALALTANAPPTDLSFARQKRAGAILQPLFDVRPDHPGIAHYLIHTYDAPPLAELGVAAALKYSQIAPSVPHAQHMPSHIFTRLGMWEASIAANRGSADAAAEYEEANRIASLTMDRVHAWDYLVYAYLQRGEEEKALGVLQERSGKPAGSHLAIDYALAAMPARYALERGDWRAAAELEVRPSPGFPAAQAITHFARGIGAARAGNPAAAQSEIAPLVSIRDALHRSGDTYWAQIVDAKRLAVEAWTAHARGNNDEALRLAAAAAELEEQVEKHPVTPGPILPARELEGDLLMSLERYRDALRSYEKTLAREPNRARATFGAARAAELTDDLHKAERHYVAFADLMSAADRERPDLQAARAFLARR